LNKGPTQRLNRAEKQEERRHIDPNRSKEEEVTTHFRTRQSELKSSSSDRSEVTPPVRTGQTEREVEPKQ